MKLKLDRIRSNPFFIPAAIFFIGGCLLLGYSVVRHPGNADSSAKTEPPWEAVSKIPPKSEDVALNKTLTEKGSKPVSIDLKPGGFSMGTVSSNTSASVPKEAAPITPNVKEASIRSEIKPPEKNQSKLAPLTLKPRYTVQISSHQEKRTADKEVKKMKGYGFVAKVISSELPGKGTWYRVRLGSFADKTAAEKKRADIRRNTGMPSIIVIE